MIIIPPGSYGFGSPPNEFGSPYNEGYILDIVFEEPFGISQFEVTFKQWDLCAKDQVCRTIDDEGYGRGDRPVMNVSWEDTQSYIRWLKNMTGRSYRLPSEAEWEYVAQSGTKRARYFGIPPTRTCEFGNGYDETAEREYEFGWRMLPCSDGESSLAKVGSYKPNSFGVYDMLGNVWEWVEDCLNPNWRHSRVSLNGQPFTNGDCDQRAYRGGSWLTNQPYYLRTAERYKYLGTKHIDLGFRVALDLDDQE
jgi:formylglycine-generating enzyme required for sulfatase activity